MLKEQRKIRYNETKRLEAILHPGLKINGIDILHEHLRTGYIRFSAWVGDNLANTKEVCVHRNSILALGKAFYAGYAKDMHWLTVVGSNIRGI